MNISTKTTLAAILLVSTFNSPFLFAANNTPNKNITQARTVKHKAHTTSQQKAIKDKQKSQQKLLKKINRGVSEGLDHVLKATRLINEDKLDNAIKELQAATGKFDVAVAANPKLRMVPIASQVRIYESVIGEDDIKARVDTAISQLKDYQVQAATALLTPLRDDMETRTTMLPISTYPVAIKLATQLLVEGNKQAALETLTTALTTLVDKVSIIPLPLLRAESNIKIASDLDKNQDKDRIQKLLAQAGQQLKIARLLGYTSDDAATYEDLDKQISALQKEINGDNVVEKLYRKLRTSFSTLTEKLSKQVADK